MGNQLSQNVIGVCLNKHEKQTLIEMWLRESAGRFAVIRELEERIESDLPYVQQKLKKGIRIGFKEHRLSIEVPHWPLRTTRPCEGLKIWPSSSPGVRTTPSERPISPAFIG